jgi:hypothetical protein
MSTTKCGPVCGTWRGEAEVVSEPAEQQRAIHLLRAKYPQYDVKMLVDDAPVLRITAKRITRWGKLEPPYDSGG